MHNEVISTIILQQQLLAGTIILDGQAGGGKEREMEEKK